MKLKYSLYLVGIAISTLAMLSCNKNDYLDIDASDRPPLSAHVKFVNARPNTAGVHFWDFTRQVTTAVLARNTASTGYLETQFGKVQFNLTEGSNTTYKVSYVFGGSPNFIRELGSTSFSGPNGPIATYFHTLFAVPKLKPIVVNANLTLSDSLVLVYDDLTAPAGGKAKIRFANFSPDAPSVDLTYSDGAAVFSNVSYGTFGHQTVIPYTNGKSPDVIPGLSWKTLGPFKEIPAGVGQNLVIRRTAGAAVLPVTGLTALNLEAGKIYTVFINGSLAGSTLTATVISHN